MIKRIAYTPRLGLSDHVCLMYNLEVYTPELKKLKPKFCYHKGDYIAMNKYLKKIDWAEKLQGMNTEEAWLYFSTEFSNAMNTYIPREKRTHQNDEKPMQRV